MLSWVVWRRCSPWVTGPRTAGPRPAQWLDEKGYDSTLAYVRAMAVRVLEETGLLPHLNPGVMSWEELNRLKPVSPSMGMMLETTSRRLFETKGEAHYGSPDKDPEVRMRVLEDAGRLSIPFTTGLLVGIGETLEERAETIFALRQVSRAFGAVQEVIVQNFRAKPDTPMRHADDLGLDEYRATIAVTRIVLGPKARVQAPPNLVDLAECRALIEAGVDDWGGVSPLTPDHVNPERPWPSLERLRSISAECGFELKARLTVHPEYVRAGEPWLDPRVSGHVAALATDEGLAKPGVRPVGLPWQEPDGGFASRRPHRPLRGRRPEGPGGGRTEDRRSDFANVYGDWDEVQHAADRTGGPAVLHAEGREAFAAAETDPGNLSDEHALTLMTAEGDLLARGLPARRRPAPRDRRRRRDLRRQPQHQLHQRLLRRLPVLRLRPAPHRRRRLLALPRRGRRPRRRRPGSSARPRSACRAASTPSCRRRRTSTWSPPSSSGSRRCTSTRSARWRSSTAPPAPGCPSRTS